MARSDDSPAWGYVSVGDALAVLNGCIGMLAACAESKWKISPAAPAGIFSGWEDASSVRSTGEAVSHDHCAFKPGDLARARDAPGGDRQLHGVPVAIFHGSAAGAGARSADERRSESPLARIPDEGPIGALPKVSRLPSGAGWPFAKQKHLEEAASELFHADVPMLCEPGDEGHANDSMNCWRLDAALPAFSNAITHAYFSHAEDARIRDLSRAA